MISKNQDEQNGAPIDSIVELIFELRKNQIDKSFEENLCFFKQSLREMYGYILDEASLSEWDIECIKTIPPANYYILKQKSICDFCIQKLTHYIEKNKNKWKNKIEIKEIPHNVYSRVGGSASILHTTYGKQLFCYLLQLHKKYNVAISFHLNFEKSSQIPYFRMKQLTHKKKYRFKKKKNYYPISIFGKREDAKSKKYKLFKERLIANKMRTQPISFESIRLKPLSDEQEEVIGNKVNEMLDEYMSELNLKNL